VHPLALMPLIACVVCSAYCLTATPATYNMGNRRLRWLGKLVFACPALWAFSEVGLAVADTAAEAEAFVPLPILALVVLGPATVDTAQGLTLRRGGRLTQSARALYLSAGVLVIAGWTTSWCYRGVVAVPWGFALQPGPLFPVYIGFTVACGVYTWFVCREVIADALEIRPDPGGRGPWACRFRSAPYARIP